MTDDDRLDLRFDGTTYEPQHDKVRLGAQFTRVRDVMRDGAWRTLRELSEATNSPEASVSARLRDLRKPRFGGLTVERRRRGAPKDGLHEYRLVSGAS